MHTLLITVLFISLSSCSSNENKQNPSNYEKPASPMENIPESFSKVGEISLPQGYKRISGNGFGDWLRSVRLKPDNTVYLYDGRIKAYQSAQFAVLDIPVPDRDLQQCADAVMRLRAEYLLAEGKYEDIVFYDNAGTEYQFQAGSDFNRYLLRVFGMCGTASLAKQMSLKTFDEAINAGDVFIRGGFPGHAVIVMDVARNKDGKTIFLLAQSYMPAQNIHVLKNPENPGLSPWYEVNERPYIETPEYTFKRSEFREW